jgi:hypothetical protein
MVEAGSLVDPLLQVLQMRRTTVALIALTALLTACGGSRHASSASDRGGNAQLRFYDWEPNIYSGPNKLVRPEAASASTAPNTPIFNLYDAVLRGSKSEPRAEASDIPAGGPSPAIVKRFDHNRRLIERYYDQRNDASGAKFYLFGPAPAGGRERALLAGPESTCGRLLARYKSASPPRQPTAGTQCADELRSLGAGGPPTGSRVLKVPKGVVIIGAQAARGARPGAPPPGYVVLEDDSELSGRDIRNPKQQTDLSGAPDVTFDFTGFGRLQFAAATKRIAVRGAAQLLPPGTPAGNANQRFAITLDNQVLSLDTVDFRERPNGIDGRAGAEINHIGSLQEAARLAQRLR